MPIDAFDSNVAKSAVKHCRQWG
ncbi:uncharacterized protein G2W53_018298 [Senna tora]|uniref:Uncharacterized protein n=1 Tax=Senna tora TaxID=362788 RepID=A0A834WRI5_9FABA|nr:uncharacterized protein G2W53_018298 [Senna tora]